MSAIIEAELDDILVFHEVVEKQSFTAAGKQLELPTSTISRRVHRLEDRLGVRLLQRTTRRLRLTDAGRIYYQRSLQAVGALEEAEQAVSQLQATPRGLLRVTAPVDFHQFMPSMGEFLRKYPEVEVALDLSNRYVDLIQEGFDVAIRAGALADSGLVAKKLAVARFALVASSDYLEREGTPENVLELKTRECLINGTQPHATWKLLHKKKVVNVAVRGRLAANHLDMLLRAAQEDLGIALLPLVRCAPAINAGQLIEILPDACPTIGAVSAVYPSREYMSPALRVFIDHLVEHIDFVERLDVAKKT